ncbi:glycerophosphoryl diester phosphodiesterase family protein [Candidatus Vecturithrix granuli]|uniref:Glycerophosphoryl diester phosphodiesterase family protein n=1 Tax=Vecturithrix granuli TaxID=1499967 RepID=A0A081C958_VECG1|nr:glycerophosphoryl diester phosphodiesterase family protein [Candidatus Vecturithrix granuli]
MQSLSVKQKMFRVIGHRGAAGHAPENTLASFQKGLEFGADMLELDIHMSKDGELIVMHDPRLERTTNGSGYIKDYTVKELKQFDAAKKFEVYRGERIPTLQEVFDFAKERATFAIEIKNCPILYPDIEKKLVRLIEKNDLVDNVIVIAFYHPSLKKIKEYNPEITTGILYAAGLVEPWSVAETVGADALHPEYDYTLADIIEAAHQRGYPVHPWTINSAEDMQRWIDYGVDGIASDFPDVLAGIVKNRSGN